MNAATTATGGLTMTDDMILSGLEVNWDQAASEEATAEQGRAMRLLIGAVHAAGGVDAHESVEWFGEQDDRRLRSAARQLALAARHFEGAK